VISQRHTGDTELQVTVKAGETRILDTELKAR
jgi:hypothetical protein